ncbi:MerR family transcriptional regulator [Microbacterium murale]|uniref:MerR family transcriptional regulator/heat shock protein HspR n=1 Tax=Microbacterium murale TaxID=1081040 RepID=A0ABU0P7E4_9MICO|nr:MerR family transcriptional regulator [Microbacterium murale]MDQ0642817.1 MerR family transcriptional regulator/heat shock protein HspR [Microbacterium murale]
MAERKSYTPVYGIAVAAALVGLPEATLRLFESKGLLTPSRSDGGTRRYSDDDIERMQRAARLRDDGINIAGISRVLDLEDENAELRGQLDESSE